MYAKFSEEKVLELLQRCGVPSDFLRVDDTVSVVVPVSGDCRVSEGVCGVLKHIERASVRADVSRFPFNVNKVAPFEINPGIAPYAAPQACSIEQSVIFGTVAK